MPLPFALVMRLGLRGFVWELAAAGLYVGAYILAWRIIGLDQSDRALLDRLFKREGAPVLSSG